MRHFQVLFEGDSTLTITAKDLDEAWEKAKRLGRVLELIEIEL